MSSFTAPQRIAVLSTVLVCGAGLTLAVVGNPFGTGGGSYGVPREIATPDLEQIEEERALVTAGLAPHLRARNPSHLEELGVREVEAEQHAPRPAGPGRAPAAAPSTAPPTTTTGPAAPTTTTGPAAPTTTTTTAPPPTTLPPKKTDEETPVAAADSYSVPANTIVELHVLANDVDPDGDINQATIEVVTEPAHASRFTVAGSFIRYRSLPSGNSGFSTEDSLVYRVCDADGFCDTALVSITIETG